MREDAAISPRASATVAEHAGQAAMCASSGADSSGDSSPSSHV
jgi:hypothetical protein